MIFLIGSILLSTFLAIAFKICDKVGINKFQAIVFNYITCVFTGSQVNGSLPAYSRDMAEPWFKWALIMGVGFVVSFNLIALTVQKNGLAVASVSSKLSLVIPFVASLLLYGEEASIVKIAGILMALVAVMFTLYPSKTFDKKESKKKLAMGAVILPLVVFLATGLLDSLVKYVEQNFLNGANNNEYLVTAFTVAFLAGFIFLIAGLITRQLHFQAKAILAGILIGIPNYFSIWFLMKVLKMYSRHSSVVIPVTNMGIVLVSALVAAFVYKEHLKRINWVGIVLSILAICMIAFG
jgi:drug/metabolite transporter (DMT)-like permease